MLLPKYLQLMKFAAGLQSRPSTSSGSSTFSPARTVHSLVRSHSNTFHCWDAHISNTKSAVDTGMRMIQRDDLYHHRGTWQTIKLVIKTILSDLQGQTQVTGPGGVQKAASTWFCLRTHQPLGLSSARPLAKIPIFISLDIIT